MTEALISIRAAAKKIGITDTTLGRQIKAGSVRSHGGKVRLSEVSEDRKKNVDHGYWSARKKPAGRGSETKANAARTPHAQTCRTPHAANKPIDDREPVAGYDVERILVDGKFMTIRNAQALAETYRARLAKLQYEAQSGDAAKAEADRWKAWAPRAADLLAEQPGMDRAELTAALADLVLREITDQSNSDREAPQPRKGKERG
jgi:hypothetical protein